MCNNSTSRGYCNSESTLRHCDVCNTEEDCGGSSTGNVTNLCWEKKDSACEDSFTCSKDSTKNSCGPCKLNTDCGAKDDKAPWFCWKAADPNCKNDTIYEMFV